MTPDLSLKQNGNITHQDQEATLDVSRLLGVACCRHHKLSSALAFFMPLPFQPISYESLNARQQESYNFQKLSGVLAGYGFVTMRLSDDWNGADFLAQHISGYTLRVQLKGRLTFASSYVGKDLWVAFRTMEQWYLFPHDLVLEQALALTNISNTESWAVGGKYSFPTVPASLLMVLAEFRL